MKNLTLTMIIACLVGGIFAQSQILSKPYSAMWLKRGGISTLPIGQDGSTNYLFVTDRQESFPKAKAYADKIYKIDKNTLKSSEITVNVSNRHYLVNAICSGDDIIALYRSDTKKGDMVTFSVAKIAKGSVNFTLTDDNSVQTEANPKFWPYYETATSPDGKLMAALMTVTGKGSILENLFAIVVDNTGEILWSGKISADFGGRSFGLANIVVDNDGNVYFPAYTCDVKGDKVSNVEFQITKVHGDESDTYSFGMAFGKPQDFTTKILSDGDIAVAGYHTDSYKNTTVQTNGYFFVRFNTKNGMFTDERSYDFSGNYAQKKQPARLASVLANQQYSITAGDLFELADGSVVLCGEHRFIKQIRDMNTNSISYNLLTKNILVATMRKDGSSDFSMIGKQQQSVLNRIPNDWRVLNISYTAFANGNDMYFVFNEDKNNIPYPGREAVCGMFGPFFTKPGEAVLMKLSTDQEITQTVLPDNSKQIIRAVEFTDGDNFYATGITKGELLINKFSVK